MSRYFMATVILSGLVLSACTNLPPYVPNDTTTFPAYRDCRVAYEQAHMNPNGHPGFSLCAECDDIAYDKTLEGPAMDKSVNACMAAKGFHLELSK